MEQKLLEETINLWENRLNKLNSRQSENSSILFDCLSISSEDFFEKIIPPLCVQDSELHPKNPCENCVIYKVTRSKYCKETPYKVILDIFMFSKNNVKVSDLIAPTNNFIIFLKKVREELYGI